MRHRRLTASLALAGLGLCFVTACGGAGLPAASPAAGNPAAVPSLPTAVPSLPTALPSLGNPDKSLSGMHACKLVSASVVTQVLGSLLEEPYETPDGLECFSETAVPGGGGPTYILSITTKSGYEAAKAFAEGVAESGSKAERFASAHDLGDDTFSISTQDDYSLWVVKSGVGVEVNVNDLDKGPSRSHDLAAAALNRL